MEQLGLNTPGARSQLHGGDNGSGDHDGQCDNSSDDNDNW